MTDFPDQTRAHDAIGVRPFNGSLADAEGILAVERATFNESPYSPEQVRLMLADGPQRAWLAVEEDGVVGFVIAFPTGGLWDTWWEVDLLAVLPIWRGRRLATRLIQVAAASGATTAGWARALVAADNKASARAFSRAGFRMEQEVHKLLICRSEDPLLSQRSAPNVVVREAADVNEIGGWLAGLEAHSSGLKGTEARDRQRMPGKDLLTLEARPDLKILLAEQGQQPAGYAELIQVQTLLYRGVWLESLVAPNRAIREALVQGAMSWARTAALDEIGSVVPSGDQPSIQTLLATGFRSLGDYRWFTAGLPPSDSASSWSAGHLQAFTLSSQKRRD
jgi:ribosomal protein S18 acetylase RimI-like enzyme